MKRGIKKELLREAVKRYQEHMVFPYGEMVALDGFDALCAFTEYFGGDTVYVPSLHTICAPCIDLDILRRYNGKNVAALAAEYGFSVRTIRNVIRRL